MVRDDHAAIGMVMKVGKGEVVMPEAVTDLETWYYSGHYYEYPEQRMCS